jgi:secondary thiamine-phosphate synthase enzyme
MRTFADTISISTDGNDQIVDVTQALQTIVAESGIDTGQVTAMVVGSTASLSTLEYEPGLVGTDIAVAMERLAPRDGRYAHEETWHDDNGHSHVRACLIGPSLALPVVEGRVPLGTWQQTVLIDFDTRPRRRTIVVTVIGTPPDAA